MGRIVGAVLVVLIAGLGASGDDPTRPAPRDPHSLANPGQVRVRHLDLDLTVDFEHKEIRGTAVLDVEFAPDAAPGTPLVLDSKGLVVEKAEQWRGDRWSDVSILPDHAKVDEPPAKADAILGRALTIPLARDARLVRITYKTRPDAGALQWLEPPLTAGKKKPFLFTQSEAIQARTWLPLQDSPGVRVTYDAKIRVPEGLTAVMAADSIPKQPGGDPSVFRFRMSQPIPSYLIALAVGDLEFRTLGPRTGVWAEPSVVEKAAREFADAEKMVEAAESRFGPYRWGRYDILVLPPSFPFGGMENPKLTFATPTVLAGDRSLVALVAHELAHSWSGNLVTNATWRDFWLNEGFTTYIERRIVEDLYGPDRAGIEAVLGLQELRDDLSRLPERDQILHIDLEGRDPDEGMTQVAYEKGALFLTQLERAFGRDRFDPFLRDYFDRHAFRSITTADFLDDLKAKLFPLDPAAASKVDLAAWVEAPGLKAAFVEPTSTRLDAVDRLAREWVDGQIKADQLPAGGWSTQEWLRFLRDLPIHLPVERMGNLDGAFGLTGWENAEVAAEWLRMAIRSGYHAADARLESFLTSIGRRKFLMPLYRELIKTPEGAERARAIYAKARPAYHPIAADSVDKLLGVTPPRRN